MSFLKNLLSGIGENALTSVLKPEQTLSDVSSAVNSLQMPVETPSPARPEPTGMFGLKGTARDILGTLGDAFLVQAGHNPIYSPTRQREKIGAAVQDYNTNPNSDTLGGIQALDPELAAKLEKQRLEMERAAAQETRNIEEHGWGRAEEGRDQYLHDRKVIGNSLNLLAAANEASWPSIRTKVMEALGERLPFDIPETYDPEFAERSIAAFMDPDKWMDNRRDQKYKDERLEDYDRAEDRQRSEAENRNRNRDARTGHSASRVSDSRRRTDYYVSGGRGPSRRSSSSSDDGGIPREPGVYRSSSGKLRRRNADGSIENID